MSAVLGIARRSTLVRSLGLVAAGAIVLLLISERDQ